VTAGCSSLKTRDPSFTGLQKTQPRRRDAWRSGPRSRPTGRVARLALAATLTSLCLLAVLFTPIGRSRAIVSAEHELVAQVGGASYAVHAAHGMVLVGMGPNLYVLPEPQTEWSPCGTVNTLDIVRGITSNGDYAYIAAGSAGLRIVSLADPCSPFEVTAVRFAGSATTVAVAHEHAYVGAGESGLAVIDIRDPARPHLVRMVPFEGRVHAVDVVGQFAYVAAGHGALRVLDLSDPAHPQEAGAYLQVYEALDVAVIGQYAYLAAGEDGLKILSLENPARPTLLTSQSIEAGFAAALVILNDGMEAESRAYIAAREGGVRVISVTDPMAPYEMDPLVTVGLPSDLAMAGPWLHVASGPGGVHAFSLQSGGFSDVRSLPGVLCDARDVAQIGSQYVVAGGELGVHSVSWQHNRLQIVDTADIPGEAVRLTTLGANAYVAARDAGLCILSTAAHGELTVNACLRGPGPANGVAIRAPFAYVACGSAGLWIVDVHIPSNPVSAGAVDTPGEAVQVALMGDYVLVADGDRGMRVISIAEPGQAREVGRHFETPGHASSIMVAGNYAYLTDGEEGLHIISLADPLTPEIVGSQPLAGFAFDVHVVDSVAFVAAEQAGLHLVSTDMPELPTVRKSIPLPGAVTGLDVGRPEGPVIAAARDGGLLVVGLAETEPIYLPLVRRSFSGWSATATHTPS